MLARVHAVLYDRKSRDVLLQGLLIAALLATLWFFVIVGILVAPPIVGALTRG